MKLTFHQIEIIQTHICPRKSCPNWNNSDLWPVKEAEYLPKEKSPNFVDFKLVSLVGWKCTYISTLLAKSSFAGFRHISRITFKAIKPPQIVGLGCQCLSSTPNAPSYLQKTFWSPKWLRTMLKWRRPSRNSRNSEHIPGAVWKLAATPLPFTPLIFGGPQW